MRFLSRVSTHEMPGRRLVIRAGLKGRSCCTAFVAADWAEFRLTRSVSTILCSISARVSTPPSGFLSFKRSSARIRASHFGGLKRLTFTVGWPADVGLRSEEHTSELQSLMRISYAV